MQSLHHTASLPLTSTLPWHALIRLGRVSRAATARADEVLVREGESPPYWHFLDSGAVALSVSSRAGRRCVLSILGPGALFGPSPDDEVGPRPIQPEARALMVSTVLIVPAAALDRLIQQDGAFGSWVCGSLQRQSERFQKTLVLTLALPIAERVLETLVSLAETHGRPAPGGTRISFPLRQETLAFMIGASRESVNRAIVKLEATGAIRRTGHSYVIGTEAIERSAAAYGAWTSTSATGPR
jgi:CRP-like cAMP-binding protein